MTTNSFQFHNKNNQPLCAKVFYSSSETILVDDESSDKIDKLHLNHDDQKSSANSGNNKSLKINVMRDLKSAQKLKSAFTNSKFSKNISSFCDSVPSSALTFVKTSAGFINPNNSFMDETFHLPQSQADKKETFTNVKRSQTFSVSTNNSLKTRSNTTSILPLPNNADNILYDSIPDFNLTDNLSPTNSQSSIYNDTRMCNNFGQQGILLNRNLVLRVYLEYDLYCSFSL